VLVFSVLLYIILYLWYPEPFFTAQGGWQGIRLMAFVDLVLGPALTFIVYDRLKKRKLIVFDLSIITIMQVIAFAWGGYTVYIQRPVALVYWANAFYTVTADEYTIQGIEHPDFSQYHAHTPPLIFSRPVANFAELEKSRELSNNLIPAYAHVAFYENIKDNLEAIFASEVNIWEVILLNTEMQTELNEITQGDIDAYKYVALKAKYQNMILIMKDNGDVIGKVKAPYLNKI
jgi:hypothetical protein